MSSDYLRNHFTPMGFGRLTCTGRKSMQWTPPVKEFQLVGSEKETFLIWSPPSGTLRFWSSERTCFANWPGTPMGCVILKVVNGLRVRSHLLPIASCLFLPIFVNYQESYLLEQKSKYHSTCCIIHNAFLKLIIQFSFNQSCNFLIECTTSFKGFKIYLFSVSRTHKSIAFQFILCYKYIIFPEYCYALWDQTEAKDI